MRQLRCEDIQELLSWLNPKTLSESLTIVYFITSVHQKTPTGQMGQFWGLACRLAGTNFVFLHV